MPGDGRCAVRAAVLSSGQWCPAEAACWPSAAPSPGGTGCGRPVPARHAGEAQPPGTMTQVAHVHPERVKVRLDMVLETCTVHAERVKLEFC